LVFRVLLVEDSQLVRERLAQLVSELPGFAVVGHADAEAAAIDHVERLRPDVLVLDIRLREGSGIEVLKYTKEHSPATQVIVLTNYAEPQYRRLCLDHGARHFLDKSGDFGQVREALADLAEPRADG
jgi:DNA-binding NarL/FixJ family response regulator